MMETVGMVRIFQRSLSHRSVRYTSYIGDGDSKTFSSITASNPYGEDITVSKIECASRDPIPIPLGYRCHSSSTHLMEDETFNDSDIINNLVDYEDGQKEPDSLRADTIYAGIQLSNKSEKYLLKLDNSSKRSLKFQKELSSCILFIVTFTSS
ncbi:uncharacterized protein TNCV_4935631 [Trichonephila clavipes]|nr:uncharacterized protein TNCV_4935631 [Trichonephila clavipes]